MFVFVINYLLVILILVLPFVYILGLQDPFEFPKAVVLIYVCITMLFLYGYGIITKNIQKVKLSGLHYLLFAYFTVLTLSSLFGGDFNKSLWGQYYRYQGLLTQGAFLIFFFIISQYKSLKIDLNRLYRILAYTSIFTAIIVIIQAVLYFIFHHPIYTYNGRMTAFLGNANFTAGFLSLSIVYLYPIVNKKLRLILFILFLTAITLTFSRSGLTAFLIGCFLLAKPTSLKIRNLMIIFMALFIILILPLRTVSYFDNRAIIWTKGITAFLQKPILGWGVENFENAFKSQIKPNEFDLFKIRVDKAHNEPLEILVSTGLLGFLIWLYITYLAFKKLWKNRSQPVYQTNLVVLVVFLILAQMNVLNINEYLFYFLAIGFAASEN